MNEYYRAVREDATHHKVNINKLMIILDTQEVHAGILL